MDKRDFGTDWNEAEKFCDGWAGDAQLHIAVVEDFDHDNLMVMPYDQAEAYVQAHDAEIQYDADHTPETAASRS